MNDTLQTALKKLRLSGLAQSLDVRLQDWGKLIGDVPSATAILDRFLHHAEMITITGKSYRLRNKTAQKAEKPNDDKK